MKKFNRAVVRMTMAFADLGANDGKLFRQCFRPRPDRGKKYAKSRQDKWLENRRNWTSAESPTRQRLDEALTMTIVNIKEEAAKRRI